MQVNAKTLVRFRLSFIPLLNYITTGEPGKSCSFLEMFRINNQMTKQIEKNGLSITQTKILFDLLIFCT